MHGHQVQAGRVGIDAVGTALEVDVHVLRLRVKQGCSADVSCAGSYFLCSTYTEQHRTRSRLGLGIDMGTSTEVVQRGVADGDVHGVAAGGGGIFQVLFGLCERLTRNSAVPVTACST
jgi:hypothetical protein